MTLRPLKEPIARVMEGLGEAVATARLASSVAQIIQTSREEDASATRTAYRILGHLGVIEYHEPKIAESDRLRESVR
jgi:hypothetical protein